MFKEVKSLANQIGISEEKEEKIHSEIRKINKNLTKKNEAETILKYNFGTDSEDLNKNILYWKNEIGKLEEFKDKAKDLVYKEDYTDRLKANKVNLEQEKERLQKNINEFFVQLQEVEREVNETLRPSEYLHCKTYIDTCAIKDKLQSFKDEIEKNKEETLAAIKIFEEIEKEEEEKISEIFGKESPISKYFQEITGDIYKEVEYLTKEKKIQVKTKDDSILLADKLSSGAYDQLYISIRLALGERLLKGDKGFFIMDDPFIKADTERLQRQIEILKRIEKSGWQIIYFTAKDEVLNALEEDIQSGKINYKEIQGVYS